MAAVNLASSLDLLLTAAFHHPSRLMVCLVKWAKYRSQKI
jgi:hypothetical protein